MALPSIIYILGAVHGVFLAAVLASRRHNALPNRLLAAVMLVFSLDLAMAAYHTGGYDTAYPHLIGLDLPVALLYGPLLYLYARTLSAGEASFRKIYGLHFVPFVLLVLYLLPFYFHSGTEKLAILHQPDLDPRMRALAVINPLKLIHGGVYIVLIIVLLRRHRRRIAETFSFVERINLAWLRNLTGGIVVMVVLTAVFYLLSLRESTTVLGLDPASAYDDYTLLCVTIFVYAIGYFGLRQPEIYEPPYQPALNPNSVVAPVPETLDEPEDRPRYVRSGMDPETAQQHLDALRTLMDAEKPYRRGDLTLQDLAEALTISPHNLTEVINTQAGENFYDFVNGYRVREVQQRLVDPAYAHWTVLAVGLEAGFNAKSSFNAVFKKHTQMTPSQYRKRFVSHAS